MFSAGDLRTGTLASSVSGPVWSLSAVAMLLSDVEAVAGPCRSCRVSISAWVTVCVGRVGPGLADLEQGVVVAGRVGAADDRARVGERVGHHDAGQRLVAGVLRP